MTRAVWTGALSFGLVHVPVRLYTAVVPHEVRFRLLHDEDGAPIHQKRVCAQGHEVPYEHVVKGYELDEGRFVEVTRGELEAFDPQATRTIAFEDFVPLEDIDPVFYETAYHVVPDEGAERAYALLTTALERTGRVGVARLVLRAKGHLGVVRPYGRGLLLSTLHYADEVLAQDELAELAAVRGVRLEEREVAAAARLVEASSARFEPERYRDPHRERLLAFLDKRARGERPGAAERVEPPPSTPAADLMRALEASLGELRRTRGADAGQPDVVALPERGAFRVSRAAARASRASSNTRRAQRDPGKRAASQTPPSPPDDEPQS